MTGQTAPTPGDPVPAEIEDLPPRSAAPGASSGTASQARPAARTVKYGDGAVIACDELVRIYKRADARGRRAAGPRPADRGRRDDRDRRRVGQWQVHPAQHPRRPRRAHRRAARSSPAYDLARLTRSGADPLPPARRRDGLAADGAQPPAVPERGRRTSSCRWSSTAARSSSAPGPSSCSSSSASRSAPDPPAGQPLRRRAAARRRSRSPSPTTPTSSSPTSQPASSTAPTSSDVFELLRRVNRELGTTVVVVTHDRLVSRARPADRRDPRRPDEHRDGAPHRAARTVATHRVIAEEFAVLDRAGRLQLPRAHIDALDLADRVRLRLEEDHVGVWPDRPDERSKGDKPQAPAGPTRARRTRRASDDRRCSPAPRPMVEARALARDYPVGRRRRPRPARDRPRGRAAAS